jgi:hypothetical protein
VIDAVRGAGVRLPPLHAVSSPGAAPTSPWHALESLSTACRRRLRCRCCPACAPA